MTDPKRREVLGGLAAIASGCSSPGPGEPSASASENQRPATTRPGAPMSLSEVSDLRTLGKTAAKVEAFSLGGEGVLRTTGREREAVAMILRALELGVRYCDTAPAYAGSQDYYGAAFRAAGKGAREKLTLATKTHVRTRDGSLKLLDDSLKRLGTNYVDIWQMHDLRDQEDLDAIFGRGGAIEAAELAKQDGRVRFIGLTGHHDPAILLLAMRRYAFDTVLAPINPADPRRAPFVSTVLPEARKQGMGVIGMKALAVGRIPQDGLATADELIRYAASVADTVIVGCSSIDEVQSNLSTARTAKPFGTSEARALEARLAPRAERYDTFKA